MFDKKSLRANARVLLVLGATVMSSAPLCVHADSPFEPVTVKVKFADLDTSTPKGAQQLYTRIENAAYNACGESKFDTPEIMNAPGPCVRDTIGRAVHASNLASLAQLFIQKNGVDAAQQFGITSDVRTAKK